MSQKDIVLTIKKYNYLDVMNYTTGISLISRLEDLLVKLDVVELHIDPIWGSDSDSMIKCANFCERVGVKG